MPILYQWIETLEIDTLIELQCCHVEIWGVNPADSGNIVGVSGGQRGIGGCLDHLDSFDGKKKDIQQRGGQSVRGYILIYDRSASLEKSHGYAKMEEQTSIMVTSIPIPKIRRQIGREIGNLMKTKDVDIVGVHFREGS